MIIKFWGVPRDAVTKEKFIKWLQETDDVRMDVMYSETMDKN